ncbi:hypothetical protein P3342_013425 [Pyrenophora teres f. teres]|nr:hypothetical protein P3342_013425 [Pyrenophora teres f. teres]
MGFCDSLHSARAWTAQGASAKMLHTEHSSLHTRRLQCAIMNLSLVDPFVLAQDCPDVITGRLRSGHSTSIRFSHRGDLLASGRHDGIVVIFDIETNGVARKLRGHTRQVQSLSWSTNDRYLLSAGQDWKCVLWDLKDGSRVRTVRFEAAIFIAELHPKNQ